MFSASRGGQQNPPTPRDNSDDHLNPLHTNSVTRAREIPVFFSPQVYIFSLLPFKPLSGIYFLALKIFMSCNDVVISLPFWRKAGIIPSTPGLLLCVPKELITHLILLLVNFFSAICHLSVLVCDRVISLAVDRVFSNRTVRLCQQCKRLLPTSRHRLAWSIQQSHLVCMCDDHKLR